MEEDPGPKSKARIRQDPEIRFSGLSPGSGLSRQSTEMQTQFIFNIKVLTRVEKNYWTVNCLMSRKCIGTKEKIK